MVLLQTPRTGYQLNNKLLINLPSVALVLTILLKYHIGHVYFILHEILLKFTYGTIRVQIATDSMLNFSFFTSSFFFGNYQNKGLSFQEE